MRTVDVLNPDVALLREYRRRVAQLCRMVSGAVRSRPERSTFTLHHLLAMVDSAAADRDESQMETESDSTLVTAAVKGDGDAFRRIVEVHQKAIALQMRRFSRDARVVEELTHDVFVEAYTSLPSYRGRSPLMHWLRRIAVRVGYRYWKQRARFVEQAMPFSELGESLERLSAGATVTPNEAGDILGDLLASLSPRDRLVLTLLYWDGCTVDEAAALSGWSRTMVKVQAHRARGRLRKLIRESGE